MCSVYVCICNGFTDRQVRAVCEKRQGRVSDVYKALGCAAKCGKCVPMVKELSRAESSPAAFADAAA
jgi:bacterioferritin-associated ferredoxin